MAEKTTAGDVFGMILMFLLPMTVAFIIGGLVNQTFVNDPNKDEKMSVICDYLHAKRQANVCVDEGRVVYPKPIGEAR